MAGLETLVPLIYHETQQPGSMLCAQHALNSLLQGNYFTAPDLSAIAQSLDTLEESYDEDRAGRDSANMDDTGFFSVQVLENALNVWGLSLVRWRSEALRAYQDHPHTQLAFILNLNQHWFSLRRFGDASPDIDADAGNGHWFNLNSFLDAPEWVSRTYLGMVLQQAEAEGYSVFAITQTDPSAPLALTRTDADHVASTLPEPTSAAPRTHLSTARTPRAPAGLEDEDLELQAALQASLGGESAPWPQSSSSSSSATPPPTLEPLQGIFPPASASPWPASGSGAGAAADPVAASTARNRALFERMRREQEFALRETYADEVAGFHHADADDDAELRRALAESEALARADRDEEDDVDIDDMDMDAGADANARAELPAWARGTALADRVYDDDDAELQAALRASLESVPPGFTIPDTPPATAPAALAPPTAAPPAAVALPGESRADDEDEYVEEASVAETETEPESEAPPAREEVVDVDEMRRRRLARFGGS
ncbi:Josephin-domain-containing protein [Auriscalpium vulgare]|uniref:Josephin-domain-containing protein n=1 Tax=Auriscalpium vulgare TaxID=40419 RepID=A0ACB8RNR9_9AGAM|nr:Josephin-domain-containing protein [Auriscalpium vulgare]